MPDVPLIRNDEARLKLNTVDGSPLTVKAAAVLDQDWDLLLTDIVMPGMDGIEVARQAAARQPGLRIMFITGFAAVALAAGDQAPAGAKVLSKPVHLREIVSEVERMIAA